MKIFTLLILLLLLPVTALAQETNVPYIYYTWDDVSQILTQHDDGTAETATVVTEGVTEWGENDGQEHWYVVNGKINISTRVTVTGHVHLILADGCKLTASNGIEVSEGNSLTIYAQSEGDDMGVLEAKYNTDAGIGGGLSNANSGTVTIHGGEVTAISILGAGIGGGGGGNVSGSSDGTVTIYGGEVTARSTNGAGIGGGGGNVSGSSDGTVTIYGGEVTAISRIGAGIGGGGGNVSGSSGSTVTIHGGTVNATSNSGAGIGSGGGNVSGGSGSFSTGTNGNAFIIASSIQDNDDKSAWSGVIFEGDEGGLVYGSPITLTTNATIPAGKTLTIENGKTLRIGEGVTLTVKEGATLTVEEGATLTNKGKIINYGTINGTSTVEGTVLIGLTEDMIAVSPENYVYDGQAKMPEVTVFKDNDVYRKDVDYTVGYSDNINAGTAKVTVTPIDSDQSALLGAAVEKTFTIAKAPAKP